MFPEELLSILDNLKNQEWIQKLAQNSEIYIVGGSVRDAFLGKKIKDIDLVVDGLSFSGIQKILKPFGKQNLVGESFSVIKFRPHNHEGEDFDIAIPRKDRKVGTGHKGFEIITDNVDILEDLKRRDFTINSMAVNVISKELLDPFNGKKDLEKKQIKATDKNAFIEDALRMLRGIQFSARFNFDIEEGTKQLMRKNAHLIKEITGERIFDEFQKVLLKEGNTQIVLNLLHETDIDKALFDKKMLNYNKGFEYLDPVSFYYMLGILGDVDPYNFYMKRLKGESKTGNAIKILDNLISSWDKAKSSEDKLFLAFKAIQKAPELTDAALIPAEMEDIVLNMRLMKIPMSMKDIQLNGDDVMALSGYKGPEVGFIMEKILRDALMNNFNWKNRKDSIEYLQKILN